MLSRIYAENSGEPRRATEIRRAALHPALDCGSLREAMLLRGPSRLCAVLRVELSGLTAVTDGAFLGVLLPRVPTIRVGSITVT